MTCRCRSPARSGLDFALTPCTAFLKAPSRIVQSSGSMATVYSTHECCPGRSNGGRSSFFYPVNAGRSQVVKLRLRHLHRTLADAPWYMRLALGLNLPHVCISLLLLDGSVTQVVSAIR